MYIKTSKDNLHAKLINYRKNQNMTILQFSMKHRLM